VGTAIGVGLSIALGGLGGVAAEPDVAAPTLSSSVPADNATGVSATVSPTLTFNEDILFNYPGGGDVILKIVGGATIETFVPSSTTAATGSAGGTATITSNVLTIDPFAALASVTEYAIQIEADCIEDTSGNAFAGIANDTTLSFTSIDTVAPTLSSSVPADNATGVAINANMVLTFSENIFFNYPGGGTFDIRVAGGAVVETFTPTSTSAATGSTGGTASITTTTLTINPFADLSTSTEYAIRIAADCLEDDAGNAYAGIANDTTLSFTSTTGSDADADAYIAEATTPPDGTRQSVITALVVALKAGGVWTKLDVLYLFAAHEEDLAKINLKDPAAYPADPVNTPTHTVDRGYAGNGTSSFINTHYIPSSAGLTMTQDSGHISVWSRTNDQQDRQDMGVIAGGNAIVLQTRIAANSKSFVAINDMSYSDMGTPGTSAGHFIANRAASGTKELFRDGVSQATASVSSTGLPNDRIYICASRDSGTPGNYTTRQYAAASIGAGFTSGEADAFYDALAAYMTAVGA
jgi:methionine-rich copper-binding protein CopC